MRKIRIKAYLIDFIVLLSVFTLINLIIPKSESVNKLEIEQNVIMEDYMSGRINFMDYVDKYGVLYYESSIEQQVNYLIYLVFMIIYFVVVPFLWEGRTLGCYLCKVQIERFEQGSLSIWQLLVRYSIVFGIGYVLLNNILLLLLSSKWYFPVISIVAIFQLFLAIFSAGTVLIHSEKRALHDLISNTEITKTIVKKNKGRKVKRKKQLGIKKMFIFKCF